MQARVIAEIGLHHGGDVDRAKDMIVAASKCGAGAVKLQYFTQADLASRPKGSGWDVLGKYYLTPQKLASLHAFANGACKVEFGLSFFGPDGVKRYAASHALDVDFVKSPAPLSGSYELIAALGRFACPRMVSYYPYQRPSFWWDTAFHCTPRYPTPDGELNLHCISTMFCSESDGAADRVGWSCHAEARHPTTAELACLAYAAGASVFEFHFRDDNVRDDSPDYKVSLWPDLLAYTVQQLKRCQEIMGA